MCLARPLLRLILKIFLLSVALAMALPWITRFLTSPRMAYEDDTAEYWAAGRLILSGQNPYDLNLVFPLYRQVGHSDRAEIIMWNPPWSLALVIPLGILPYHIARTTWFFLQLVVTTQSLNLLSHRIPGGLSCRWLVWLIGLTFYPVIVGFRGPISFLSLAGTIGALVWIEKRPLLAGMAAAMLMVKPHITYLAVLALILWAFAYRRWNFLAGFSGALLGSMLIAMALNPAVLVQYLHAWAHYPPVGWATATVGGLLRFFLGPEHFALQFVAPFLGLLWFALYFIHHRNRWVWTEQFPMLALVSVATTAYGWIADFQPALVGLLPAVFQLGMSPRSWVSVALLITYGLIQVVLFTTPFDQLWYFWLGPAMLVWFLLARRHLKSPLFLEDRPDETAH